MGKEKDFVTEIKLSDDQWAWYLTRAGFGQKKRAEYIRRIPRIVEGLEEDNERLRSNIKELTTTIEEYMEIKGCQELIADFKYTGKEGIILNQKKEISELTKSVVKLTGVNEKQKDEIKWLKTIIMDKFNYSEAVFKKLYEKPSKEENEVTALKARIIEIINENEKLKEEIKQLNDDIQAFVNVGKEEFY